MAASSNARRNCASLSRSDDQPLPLADVEQYAMPGKLTPLRVPHQNRALSTQTQSSLPPRMRYSICAGSPVRVACSSARRTASGSSGDLRQERIETGREVVAPEPGQSRESRADIVKRAIGARLQAVERDRQLIDERLQLRLLLRKAASASF